jgi:hypothetical protein
MKAPTKIRLRPVGRDRGWHLAAAAPTRVEALKAAAEYRLGAAFGPLTPTPMGPRTAPSNK